MRSNLLLREAQLADLDEVYEIFQLTHQLHCQALPQIFQEPLENIEIKNYLVSLIEDPSAVILLAELDHKMVGAISAQITQSPDRSILVSRRVVEISNVVVAPSQRRAGIGQTLMEGIHRWAREQGIDTVELTVWDFNEGAKNFYKKLGYSTARSRMWKELS